MSTGMTSTPTRKLRILCFHGYLQNAQEFAAKIGSLRKALKSRAELIFIDAPHHVEAEQSICDPAAGDPRAWWKWQDRDLAGRPSLASSYTGVEASLQLAEQAIFEHKPIDGFLGFSQGAALASLALIQCQNQRIEHKIQFAILAGAFLPKDPEYAHMMTQAAISVPTLFITGGKDQLIPLQRTEELIATFDPDSIQRYVHEGGHMVPTCSGDFKRCLQDFLEQHGSV
ncbi:TPA: Ovarian cancer-associated protein 2 [Trebouxia sp. C0004]